VRAILEVQAGAQLGDPRLDLGADLPVNHAEQVVGPVRQHPRTLIAEGHSRFAGQELADLGDRLVGDVVHQHGIGR
jgi:hypothetical protein